MLEDDVRTPVRRVGRHGGSLRGGSLRGYRAAWLAADLVAGLTVWAVLVPGSLAYATIAGVPPVVGLYAAVLALLLYALLGSSRHLVVATMSATAALSAGIVAGLAPAGSGEYLALTAALALATGLLGIAAELARLGFLASFKGVRHHRTGVGVPVHHRCPNPGPVADPPAWQSLLCSSPPRFRTCGPAHPWPTEAALPSLETSRSHPEDAGVSHCSA